MRLKGALTNGAASCEGHSPPEMFEALMCTQGLSHTDSVRNEPLPEAERE